MKIHILTLFPEAFDSLVAHSMTKRAIAKGLVTIQTHDLRRWTQDRHRTCDDKPFGGGPGMLIKPEPVFEAADELFGGARRKKGRRFIFLTPSGKRFDQKMARELAAEKELIFLCGHYEGVDQRVIDKLVTDEISVGDYILTSGEIAAMPVIDAAVRLLPGVVGREESKEIESFSGNLLEYPQYTRPAVYRGMQVPAVLLSGNHKEIERWRQEEARKRTLERRPDLLEAENFSQVKHSKAEGNKRRKRCTPKSKRSKPSR